MSTTNSITDFIDSEFWSNTYYGEFKDIIDLDYYGHFKFLMFKCDWFEGEDKYWLICVYYFQQLVGLW